MKRTTTIAIFYSGVAVICAIILVIAFTLRANLPKPGNKTVVNSGRESTERWFQIEKDLAGTNQDGKAVKLSDLKGKVWLVAEFFAVCPHCMVRNGEELRSIYDEFKGNPDFQIACISVDPESDTPDRLKQYATALGADSKNWWFINAGKAEDTHHYLEHELKFMGIRKRTDPLEIEANGLYSHDLGFILVDRNFNVVGKWPLAEARSDEAKARDPKLYGELKKELYQRIREELEKNETAGI
ncbi:SCO family protein [Luteolibacter pohnpeiensis]|uniref:SCO family protein n=1 Tax=Luteolibacter pohnpeiensis TaxID=454153 RepID=A0A934SAK4_9BACT|nr:SCO family protein [Luteolibacter pohnpeiensis]MBK1884324.1 SCO family protein [Luteolibacter pohnpeiensis]